MTDFVQRFYPDRKADPSEVGIIFDHVFDASELSLYQKYINRNNSSAITTYDLTAKVGVPAQGFNGGIRCEDNDNQYWQNSGGWTIAAAALTTYDLIVEILTAPTGRRYIAMPGYNNGFLVDVNTATTAPRISYNGGGNVVSAGTVGGCGPIFLSAAFTTEPRVYLNGRFVTSGAGTVNGVGGRAQVGTHGIIYRFTAYNFLRTDPQIRANYVSKFAKEVITSWVPKCVGEGPAGGLLTGASACNWFCPTGGSTLLFTYRQPSDKIKYGRLTLTDSGALSTRRIDIAHTTYPRFGSWLFTWEVRDPTTDDPRFGLLTNRGTFDLDMNNASAASNWVHSTNNAGVLNTTLHADNGAAVITVSSPLPSAGDQMKALLTHHPDGTWRLALCHNGTWYGSETTTSTSLTYMNSSYVSIEPRGAYVESFVRYQGEMWHNELPK